MNATASKLSDVSPELGSTMVIMHSLAEPFSEVHSFIVVCNNIVHVRSGVFMEIFLLLLRVKMMKYYVGIHRRLWLSWVELSEREIRGLCAKWWTDDVLEKIILVFHEEEEGVFFYAFLHQVSCGLKKKKWYLKKHVDRSHATNLPQPCAKCLLLKGEIWRYFAFFLILKLNNNKN